MTGPRLAAPFPRLYPASVLSVYDGDTIRVLLDRGGDDYWKTSLRLLGGNTRELSMPGGREARDYLTALLAPVIPATIDDLWDMPSSVVSAGWDKYGGRIDGYLRLPDGRDVMTTMIRAGYAAPWDGRGAAPLPTWPLPSSGSS